VAGTAVLLAAPLAAKAQPRIYRVGFLTPREASPEPPTLRAFRQKMQELGYVEGKTLSLETRFVEGHVERFPDLVADLLRRQVDVLVAGSELGALAAKKATTVVPIVFAGVSNPVAAGIVTNLAHPGGNVTGVAFGVGATGFGGKWVELLRDVVPALSQITALSNSADPQTAPLLRDIYAAARVLNVKVDTLDAAVGAGASGRSHSVMRRRAFVAGTLALLAAPLAAEAQLTGKVYRIGVLYATTGFDPSADPNERALVDGLREHGYVLGRNLAIELRSAYGKRERLPELAAELVRIPVDLILVPGVPHARVAKQATATIPIVFCALAGDPVQAGLVESFARPGGNVTGTTAFASSPMSMLAKRLELLKETLPNLMRVAMLVNPGWPPDLGQQGRTEMQTAMRTEMQTAAARLGLQLVFVPAGTPAAFPGAFATMAQDRAQALVVPSDSLFDGAANVPVIADLALSHRLPGIYGERQWVTAGGLMAYSTNVEAIWRRTASYVDRILKGAKPADLPVEQPTTFELLINLKTAKTLGLTIPPSVLARADELIE
jgi:putative ABC transport system substrate-binding protein